MLDLEGNENFLDGFVNLGADLTPRGLALVLLIELLLKVKVPDVSKLDSF
jgi:hypothetical protein